MFKRILITTLVLFSLLATATRAQNSPALTLSPSLFEISTEATKEYTKVITVSNTSELILPVNIEISDYRIDADGIPDYSEDETTWSARNWTKAEPADIILEPGESNDITLTIAVPELAEPGSHFITVFFQPVLPPDFFEGEAAQVVPFIGAVGSIDVVNDDFISPDDYLELNDFQPNREAPEINFSSEVKNNDVYFHRIEGTVSFTNLFNNKVKEIPVENITILPRSSRKLKQILDTRIFPGRYKVDIFVTDLEEEVSDTTVLWIYPTILEAGGTVLGISLLVFLILKRKNISKAIRVLSKKETSSRL